MDNSQLFENKSKTCSMCNIEYKNIELSFHKYKQYFSSYCKSCHTENSQKYKRNNPEKAKEWSKKSNEKNLAKRHKEIDEKRKQLLIKETKFCKYCQEEKPKSSFSFLKSSVDGFRGQCTDCRKVKEKKTKKPYSQVWKNKLFDSAKKNSKLMNKNIEIDINFIQYLYDSQKGLCYWSKVPLLLIDDPKHPQKPSLDRKDNSKGYTKDNVILTCFSMNFARNVNSFEVFSNFIEILKQSLATNKDNPNES